MKLSRTWIDQQLNHKQRTLLVDWLMERTSNPTGEVILQALGELFPEFSDELPSVNSALSWKSANWPTELQRVRLRRTNEAAGVLASAGRGNMDDANQALVQSAIFEQLLKLQEPKGDGESDENAPDLGDLTDAVINLGHLKAKERKLDQDERKLQLAERKAKTLDDAASEIKTTGGLTPETLRKIEEASKLL